MVPGRTARCRRAATLLIAVASAWPGHAAEQTKLTTRDGVYTQAQADAGRQVYSARCSECHRDSLLGGVNESPPLKGERFLANWAGSPLRALYGRILSTMPQSDPGSLSPEEALQIVAYLLQANGSPASRGRELELTRLSGIEISRPD